ncbi:TetR/AcrR family transcriptional regulator [Leuconostoc fallax]|uniref:Transcriptional regulator TetR C-terminal Firmicutes type domain-containing protein n=2 Tax=Leuconostoc fallax TaxID=1251 RepID=A0A4R5N724_9LACO|nr:TetR/AcrR family transcriptional regulator [Leuconostoc fallax]MBU7455283.1 TetR/AcrR family transcriptional regulator [Leuconostoc fallax]MCO6183537.1 TetR/AcrR family transcriptional regulator [Leuconostoc fallax]TDG67608.1 hypothetical protein C5L23_001407 [Leuconostoc fallax]
MINTDARIIQTMNKIRNTAKALMVTQPDFAMTTFLTQAGVTRGTFYKYYDNKAHLVAEVNHAIVTDLVQYTETKFQLALVIKAISEDAAFYNAALNLNSNPSFYHILMTHIHDQMLIQTQSLEEPIQQHVRYQWEVIHAGFWGIIGKWLQENMTLSQVELLEEFSEVWRVNHGAIQQTGLSLFDFSSIDSYE